MLFSFFSLSLIPYIVIMPSTHVHLVIVIDNATDQYALKAHFLQRGFNVRHLKPFLHKTGLIKKKNYYNLTSLFGLSI